MPAPGYQDRLLDGELAPEVVISHAWMDHLARVYARFLNGEGEQLEPGNEDSPTMFAAEEDELRDTIGAFLAALRNHTPWCTHARTPATVTWMALTCVLLTSAEASSGAQRQRLEAIRAERANLLGEWEKLESKPDPVHAYTEHCSRVKRDVEKAHVYIEKTKATIAAIAQQKADFEEDIQRARESAPWSRMRGTLPPRAELILRRQPAVRDREEKRDQQAQAERVVRGQKLTPLEIQSLSSERAALTRQMQDVQQRYRTAVSRTMNLEIDLNKRIDEATALCARYEEKAQPLGLLNGPLEGYEDVPFAQEINGASDNPVPEGLGTEVKPALSKLRQKTRDEIRDVNMTDFRIESELTKLKEILADLREKETVEVQELDVVDHEKGQMQEVSRSGRMCQPAYR